MNPFVGMIVLTLPAAVGTYVALIRLRALERAQCGICELMLLPLAFLPTFIASADTLIASHSLEMTILCAVYQCAGGLLLLAIAQANGRSGWASALMMSAGAWLGILVAVGWVALVAVFALLAGVK